jgi:tetratricopeptide (TPR) repeat protein
MNNTNNDPPAEPFFPASSTVREGKQISVSQKIETQFTRDVIADQSSRNGWRRSNRLFSSAIISCKLVVALFYFSFFILFFGCDQGKRAEEARSYFESGIRYLQNNQLENAVVDLKKCIQADPNHYDAHFTLANVYFNLKQIEEAIQELEGAIRSDSKQAEPHQFLSRIFLIQMNFEKSLEEIRKAAELEPDNLDVRLAYVSLLVDNDVLLDLDLAKSELEELVQMYPDKIEVHGFMGLTYLRSGEFRKSSEKFEYIVNRFPKIFQTVYTLGIAYLRSEKYEKAIEPLKEAIRLDTENLYAKWALRLALEALGRDPQILEDPYRLDISAIKVSGPVVEFKDVAHEAGVAKVDQGRGSGWADFDLDGDLDLFTVGVHSGTALFRNNGDGTFTEVSEEAGVSDHRGGWASLFADYDNDGDPDLYITRDAWDGKDSNTMYRNNGDGTFSDVTKAAGVADKEKSSFTASFGDYDNDGYLDLLVASGLKDGNSPNSLFHNNGDGTFTDVAIEAGLVHRGPTIGCAFGDYDDDGNLDIHVVHVNGSNLLYKNNGDGTFNEVTESANARLPIQRGFVTFFFDYDNDGDLDLFTSSMCNLTEYLTSRISGKAQTKTHLALLRNNGEGTFTDITNQAGLYLSFGSMGANYGDYDYDGNLDIYLSNGGPPVGRLEPNALFRNNGDGTFTEITEAAGVGNLGKGHGVTFADYDNDGDLDIYSSIGGHYPADRTPNSLYQNPGTGNNFLMVRTIGTRSNRDGIGAKVKVTSGSLTLLRVVNGGSGFGSTNSLELEFGLGKRKKVDQVEIRWPSGLVETYENLEPNQLLIVTEGKEFESKKYPL